MARGFCIVQCCIGPKSGGPKAIGSRILVLWICLAVSRANKIRGLQSILTTLILSNGCGFREERNRRKWRNEKGKEEEKEMKLPGNWVDLVEKCRKQDEYLRRQYHSGQSWYDIISENMDGYAGETGLTRRWIDIWGKRRISCSFSPREGFMTRKEILAEGVNFIWATAGKYCRHCRRSMRW